MPAEPIEFEVGGKKLRGKFFPAKAPAKKLAILFLHGWTGMPNNDAATVMAQNGFAAMVFSLSGHNDSDGRLEDQTREESLREVVAAYDFIKQKLPPGTNIVAAGTSYGSYMAVLLSGERPLAGLQLRVPANYWEDGFDEPQMGHGADDK